MKFYKSIKYFLSRIPLVLRYGVVLACGLVLLKTIEYQFFSYRVSLELYVGLIAAFFMLVGLATGMGWINLSRGSKQNLPPESDIEALTHKELKLLADLAKGLSNQQMADANHVSINTIKSHLKNLYKKLHVTSRRHAVSKAKKLSLI